MKTKISEHIITNNLLNVLQFIFGLCKVINTHCKCSLIRICNQITAVGITHAKQQRCIFAGRLVRAYVDSW